MLHVTNANLQPFRSGIGLWDELGGCEEWLWVARQPCGRDLLPRREEDVGASIESARLGARGDLVVDEPSPAVGIRLECP